VWHDRLVLSVVSTILRAVAELAGWVALAFRSHRSLQAEVLFLRRQLALYVELGAKPRRLDPVTRISLALLSRFFDWRGALVAVRPETPSSSHRDKCRTSAKRGYSYVRPSAQRRETLSW